MRNQPGVYGKQGVGSDSNIPGARFDHSWWIDASGNFWLFGGLGYDADRLVSVLNDLWRRSPGN